MRYGHARFSRYIAGGLELPARMIYEFFHSSAYSFRLVPIKRFNAKRNRMCLKIARFFYINFYLSISEEYRRNFVITLKNLYSL